MLQQDSYEGDEVSPPSLHRYAYVLNNPVRYIDPTGNFDTDTLFTLLSYGFSFVGGTLSSLLAYTGGSIIGKSVKVPNVTGWMAVAQKYNASWGWFLFWIGMGISTVQIFKSNLPAREKWLKVFVALLVNTAIFALGNIVAGTIAAPTLGGLILWMIAFATVSMFLAFAGKLGDRLRNRELVVLGTGRELRTTNDGYGRRRESRAGGRASYGKAPGIVRSGTDNCRDSYAAVHRYCTSVSAAANCSRLRRGIRGDLRRVLVMVVSVLPQRPARHLEPAVRRTASEKRTNRQL